MSERAIYAALLIILGVWGALRGLEGLCTRTPTRWDWIVFLVFAGVLLFGGVVLVDDLVR